MYYNLETICELCGEKININCQNYDDMIVRVKRHLAIIPIPFPLKLDVELQICEHCTYRLFSESDSIALRGLQEILVKCRKNEIDMVSKYLCNLLEVSLTNENILKDTLERVL